ncbi:MAG: efflux RND transporter periplasmic adaptor subunit, partial [Bacteroidota bacterium]|nr:efflux RND transporter periplasmic adaptor subunit [Bacteroidota bacterium]
DLLTLAQEYLLAKEQYEALGNTENRYKTFLDAAERKLLLIGRTRNQIRQLTRAGTPNARMTFLAPASGVVSEIAATDGQYVGEGTTLYRIDAVNTLWIEADLYANELSRVDIGDKISVRVAGADADRIGATVAFLSPEFQNNTQLTTLRASIDNSSGQLKPGQQAQVFLTHSSQEAIAIPSDAVIRDSRGSHVYVQSGRNSFRPQTVTTGLESFDQVEITEGLKPGDTVAVTGAYLLYSEMILKKGTDPMAGHRH